MCPHIHDVVETLCFICLRIVDVELTRIVCVRDVLLVFYDNVDTMLSRQGLLKEIRLCWLVSTTYTTE